MNTPVLLAQAASRTFFAWGRIQSPADWIVPGAAFALLLLLVVAVYLRDVRSLPGPLAALLITCRVIALLALFVVYLQPQWRTERSVVRNSRVLLLVDTSLSMGLADADGTSDEATGSRLDGVRRALDEYRTVDELRRAHDVVVVRFDAESQRVASLDKLPPPSPAGEPGAGGTTDANRTTEAPAPDADWAASLEPRGTETRLGEALRQLVYDERFAPVSGIIVFSDGGHNAGIGPGAAVQLAAEARIPIYPVGVGSDQMPPNVRVSDLVAPPRAFPGDSFTVTGHVQGQAMEGQTVTVELLSRAAGTAAGDGPDAGQLEDVEQVTLPPDGATATVTFELQPEETGRRTLLLRAVPPPDDSSAADNWQEADVEIVDRKTRVLLLAGGPTREYQFLRNQLNRNSDMIVDVYLQTGQPGMSQDAHQILTELPTSPQAMFAYDVIVAIDPDWQQFTSESIDLVEQWVAEQAGGLIVVPGPIYTDRWVQDPAMSKIRALYPVEFQRHLPSLAEGRFSSDKPWPIDFTREGRDDDLLWLADTAEASASAWAMFEGVYGYYAVAGPKPAATVYAHFSAPDRGDDANRAVYFAGQFYGAGRVFYMGSGEMWRLRSIDESLFERLYTRLIRHVSQGRLLRGSHYGALLVERDRYLLGNTVHVQANLTDDQLKPLEAATAELTVIGPDGIPAKIQLAADATRVGMYRGQFTARHEGFYRLELESPADGETLTRRIQVRVPDVERQDPRRNDALLERIAADTGGKYYVGLDAALAPTAAERVVARLRDRTKTSTTASLEAPVMLWDNAWMMFAICGLLCVEWLARRLAKLA